MRSWIAPEINCSLLLVVLYLTGLKLRDLHLVTFSLRSFVLSSFVINFLFRFLFLFFLLFVVIFGLSCAFPAQTRLLNIYLS